jgi:thiol-disulfide isomerase/thioredoxin
MRKMKLKLLLFALPFLISPAFAQNAPAYKIDISIEGLKDTTVLLGHYYSESTYAKDTAIAKNGKFTFDGKKALPQGVYFLILGKVRLFEIVIGNNQQFSLATSTKDYIGSMVVTGDTDNKLFFENMKFIGERSKEADPFIKILQDSTLNEAQKQEARKSFEVINQKVLAYHNDLISKNASTMTARLLQSTKRVEAPAPPKKADGSIDSTFQLKYYREHYFDNFNLADDALIRLPKNTYKEKVDEYLDRLFPPDADTLTKAINKLIAQVKNNQETYKYLTWICLLKYQQPKYMGLDQVFVNLFDQYFATGKMDFWVNAQLKKNLKETADRIRSSALGKKSNNLILQDTQGNMRSLHNMANKYTIVYFFDPDCGHCRKETPKLVDFKNKTKYDVGIYAVAADSSFKNIKKFVAEMKMEKFVTVSYYYSAVGHYRELYDAETTPTIYVLDREKKIIGRKLPSVDDIEPFINQYERFQLNKTKATGKSSP